MNLLNPEPTDENPDERSIGQMIFEAGDPAVAPRPEHILVLRSLILDRVGSRRRIGRLRGRLMVGSGLAAAVIAAMFLALALSRPTNAWAQVARALQERPWVHTRSLRPGTNDGDEFWFSPKNGVSAVHRGPEFEFHDHALKTFTKFVAAEGVVYRLPENAEMLSHEIAFFRQLLKTDGPLKTPLLGMEVVSERRREVVEGGRAWTDIDLTFRVVDADRELQMRIRVDPGTKLPNSLALRDPEGQEVTWLFDYPDRGPADIYDLKAPRTAKIVDRTPGEDLGRILSGLKTGRVRFDDYRAIMDYGEGINIKRVFRKGRKWRCESLLSSDPKKYPLFPRDASAAWWKEHQSDYKSTVQAICDGDKVYYYRDEGNPYAPDAKEPLPLKLTSTQTIAPSDDPFMPWPNQFVEHISHTSVWQPSHEREFLLDAKPTDGPADTIRLRVHDTRFPDPGHPDLYKLWVSPSKGYMALRSESSVFEGSAIGSKLAYIDTMIIEGLARSPSGFWYPTRVRRQTSNPKTEQLWTYHLEFEVDIPDELFQPLK
jgi:hypothetical protein